LRLPAGDFFVCRGFSALPYERILGKGKFLGKFSVSANIYWKFAVGAVCGLAVRGSGNELVDGMRSAGGNTVYAAINN
jgi:hypothetical protein